MVKELVKYHSQVQDRFPMPLPKQVQNQSYLRCLNRPNHAH